MKYTHKNHFGFAAQVWSCQLGTIGTARQADA